VLIVEACLLHQASTTAHRQCLHLIAHYLLTAWSIAFEIRMRVLKVERRDANLFTKLLQSVRL
jgi:hypothetical protein